MVERQEANTGFNKYLLLDSLRHRKIQEISLEYKANIGPLDFRSDVNPE